MNIKKNSLLLYILFSFCNPSFSSTKVAEAPSPTSDVAGGMGEPGFKPPKYAVLPTGKTLPQGIFRADVPVAYSFASSGFDAAGNQGNYGLSFKRWMSGFILQYGLSNSVSVAVGVPFVISSLATMDGQTFTSNEVYNRYYNRFVSELAQSLAAGGACGSTISSCTNYINNQNGKMPSATTITLPTGELYTLNSTTPIKNQIQDLITAASAPSDGASGVGDIQLGILWNVISEESPLRHVPLYFSIGGGLRLPTGKFNLPSAMRSTGGDGTLISGGGTYDAILRWNLDYIATPGVILSWQHQMEYSLSSADLGRSSMINPNNFNTADPNSCNPGGNCGDGVGNTLRFSRKGFHYIGFLQAAWGLGNVSESMKWFGLYTQAKYNVAAKPYLNDQPILITGDQFFLGDSSMHPYIGLEQGYSAVGGIKFSGLPYMIPLDLTTEFEYPVYAKNRIVAPMNVMGTLSVYF